jgi:dTDP-4-dehydrorhamnose 3,5-epimerase
MIYSYTQISGVILIESERHSDQRGWFARTFCAEEFGDLGLTAQFAQCSTSFNAKRGTLRGLHYQAAPAAEAKLVRCVQGALFDVAVDIRPESPTFGQWYGTALTAANGNMLYIPEGCAHGFQTLVDDTEVFYQISVPYAPELSRGISWDDPEIGIDWPIEEAILSDRDRSQPGFAISAPTFPETVPALAASARGEIPLTQARRYG